MTYVIAEPCIGTKDLSCVEVCPVDCIHPTQDEPGFDDEAQLYIDPEECIDCDACVAVDALLGIDVQLRLVVEPGLVLGGVDAVDRTHLDAREIFRSDAWLGDHVRHLLALLAGS